MATATANNPRPAAYTEGGEPTLITRKKCGCCVVACVIDEHTLTAAGKLLCRMAECGSAYEDDIEEDSLLGQIFEAVRDGHALEVQPVSFVRKGRLNFDCNHKHPKALSSESES